ncbi:MAG: radical SAM protein [Planctomycetota bacterium]
MLTRTTGYLSSVSSHSLQPYRGCSFGKALCGAGCYVRHNRYVTQGRPWGEFLEVRTNAAESYLENVSRERRWARSSKGKFVIFLSSSTEPFVPQEFRYGVTRSVLEAMREEPPDGLILQTHSHRVLEYLDLYQRLNKKCDLRIHVSIETDRESIPGLPRHASRVEDRFKAAKQLKSAGIRTVITVSPILPVKDPERFFRRIAECAHAVVLDHFVEGDGSRQGQRTLKTELPAAMAAVDERSTALEYRDELVAVARKHLPESTGVSIEGFAGRFL